MRLFSIVCDHTETRPHPDRKPCLRQRLERLSQDPWQKAIRQCAVCESENGNLVDISAEVTCGCWHTEQDDDRFVLWYHPYRAQEIEKWRGHERLLAVIRLTVDGTFTLDSPPTQQGTVSPFLCLELKSAFRGIEDDALENALYAWGQALEAVVAAKQAGSQQQLVEAFLSSNAILGNSKAANLCNAHSPSPFLTFLYGFFTRKNENPPSSAERVWGQAIRRVFEVPSDLQTKVDQLKHRGQRSPDDIERLKRDVALWFVLNKHNAEAFGIDQVLWSSEQDRVTEKILSMMQT